jgi:CHAT domain-containing protein
VTKRHAIGDQLAGAGVVVGKAATEPAIREALMHSRIVHIASHGVLNPTVRCFPTSSSLRPADASARRPENDGRLETYEVLSMNVRRWLVFLFRLRDRPGVLRGRTRSIARTTIATLAQAFMFAGARNVVATLWSIDDRGAAEFARGFYGALFIVRHVDRACSSQRAMIRSARHAAPYYWAGYVLSGSGRRQAREVVRHRLPWRRVYCQRKLARCGR